MNDPALPTLLHRYQNLCNRDNVSRRISALTWRKVAIDLWIASHSVADVTKRDSVRALANDCHDRADYARRIVSALRDAPNFVRTDGSVRLSEVVS